MTLKTQQVLRLAAEALTDPRTVIRIYDGKVSRKMVRERVEEAAKKLKMVAPPMAKANAK